MVLLKILRDNDFTNVIDKVTFPSRKSWVVASMSGDMNRSLSHGLRNKQNQYMI